MEKPKWPIGMIVREGDTGPYCPECDSSLKYIFWPFKKSKHCIHPKCENYYQKYNSERIENGKSSY